MKEQQKILCKSVFKGEESTICKRQFTKAWIELIHRLEKKKGAAALQR